MQEDDKFVNKLNDAQYWFSFKAICCSWFSQKQWKR